MKAKKVLTILGGISLIAVTGVLVGSFFISSEAEEGNTNAANTYKEETVQRGDIVVGVTEMGTADLLETEISFEFEAEVEEVYVNLGEYVEAGTPLMYIDTDTLEETYDDLQNQLEEAYLELESAELSANEQKMKAEQDYDAAILAGESAEANYNYEMSDLQSDYDTILSDIESIENQQISWASIRDADPEADTRIITLKAEIATIEAEIVNLTALIEQEKAEAAAQAEEAAQTEATAQAEEVAQTEATAQAEVAVITTQDTTALEAQLAEQNTNLQTKTKELEDTYTKIQEEKANAVEQLAATESQIIAAYEKKDAYELSESETENSLANQKEQDLYEYSSASAIYENSIDIINNTLSNAQDKVNGIKEEMAQIESIQTANEVVASASGYIMSVVEAGTSLKEDNIAVSIADEKTVEVLVSIPQEDISDIEVGMETILVFDAYEDVAIDSFVKSINIVPASGMQSTVNYTVTISCDLSDYEGVVIYQSMTADVTFVEKNQKDVLYISNKCVMTEDGIEYVLVRNDDGSIGKFEVITGFSDGFDVEIVEGLEEGDIVLMESAVMTSAN